MPGIGDRLWDMGKSPAQHISLLAFGLAAIVVAFLVASLVPLVGFSAALAVASAALIALGGVFFTLALFLRAFASRGGAGSPPSPPPPPPRPGFRTTLPCPPPRTPRRGRLGPPRAPRGGPPCTHPGPVAPALGAAMSCPHSPCARRQAGPSAERG